jgi:hypothetical protein
MATSDTTAETLFAFRVERIEGLGFSPEQAAKLAEAKKVVTERTAFGSLREHEVQLQWQDVDQLLSLGATPDQVVDILG